MNDAVGDIVLKRLDYDQLALTTQHKHQMADGSSKHYHHHKLFLLEEDDDVDKTTSPLYSSLKEWHHKDRKVYKRIERIPSGIIDTVIKKVFPNGLATVIHEGRYSKGNIFYNRTETMFPLHKPFFKYQDTVRDDGQTIFKTTYFKRQLSDPHVPFEKKDFKAFFPGRHAPEFVETGKPDSLVD